MPGPKFPDQARPDVHTVQAVAAGHTTPPARRKRRKARRPASVTTIRVHPEVWKTALGLASSPRNIEIRSETEVVVHNHPPPWPRPQGAHRPGDGWEADKGPVR